MREVETAAFLEKFVRILGEATTRHCSLCLWLRRPSDQLKVWFCGFQGVASPLWATSVLIIRLLTHRLLLERVASQNDDQAFTTR